MKSLMGNLVGRILFTSKLGSVDYFATSSVAAARAKKPYLPSEALKKKLKEVEKALIDEDRGVVRRPLTPLQAFMQEKAGGKRAKGEEAGDIFKQRKQEFEKLTDHEKAVYLEKAQKDRERWESQRKAVKDKSLRARTAYNYYVAELSADRPSDLKQTEYIRVMAGDFRKLSEKQRAPYVKLAQDDKERVAALKSELPEKVKRPPNAYNLFMKDQLTGGGSAVGTIMKSVGPSWKALSPEEKKKYTDLAPVAVKAPRTRSLSAYNYFVKAKVVKRQENEGKTGFMTRVAETWKALDAKGKSKFEKLAQADRLNFPKKTKPKQPKTPS